MIKIIAAIGERNELGYLNDLPWETITEDMKQFMENTMNETLIMGRNTWDSLDRVPLPGRTMVVISRRKIRMPTGHFWYSTPEEAMRKHPISWVIGGASIYAYCLEFADEMVISHVKGIYLADTHFPQINLNDWKVVETKEYDKFTKKWYVRNEENNS